MEELTALDSIIKNSKPSEISEKLEQALKSLPDKPGVYLMKDSKGHIIYIGKAKSLTKRVHSYFRSAEISDSKIQVLKRNLADFEYFIVDNELEAIILEDNLIKKHRPSLNVLLKDDKHFPYLKLTTWEEYPRLLIARKLSKEKDAKKSLFFGPFIPSSSVWEMRRLIFRLFRIRQCRSSLRKINARRGCLNFQIKRCDGPCIGGISALDYALRVEQASLVLKGQQDHLIQKLGEKMCSASKNLHFEEAAGYRDQIKALKRVQQKQKVDIAGLIDQDVIALYSQNNNLSFQVFFIREGLLQGRQEDILTDPLSLPNNSNLASYIKQFYREQVYIPKQIFLSEEPEDKLILENFLSSCSGKKVHLHIPRRGVKAEFMQMVLNNAKEALDNYYRNLKISPSQKLLEKIQSTLKLQNFPKLIEAYDISNISGNLAVGSKVSFQDGKPSKKNYRLYRIRTVEGANDFEMLREVLKRRLKRISEGAKPDFILIDGGCSQLSAVSTVFTDFKVQDIDLAALAKPYKDEIADKLYSENFPAGLHLPSNSDVLHILQQIRDEAHRFAINYHKKLRTKKIRRSLLDEVPGIGQKRKQQLLRHFRSLKKLQKASLEELKSVPVLDSKTAENLYNFLHNKY